MNGTKKTALFSLKTKKIIAREFLILLAIPVIALIILLLTIGYNNIYNHYINLKCDRLYNEIEYKIKLADTLKKIANSYKFIMPEKDYKERVFEYAQSLYGNDFETKENFYQRLNERKFVSWLYEEFNNIDPTFKNDLSLDDFNNRLNNKPEMPVNNFREQIYSTAEIVYGKGFDTKDNFFSKLDKDTEYIDKIYNDFNNYDPTYKKDVPLSSFREGLKNKGSSATSGIKPYMPEPDYISNVHKALTAKVEGFTLKEDVFRQKLLNEADYKTNVHKALMAKVEGFSLKEDEFYAKLNLENIKKSGLYIASAYLEEKIDVIMQAVKVDNQKANKIYNKRYTYYKDEQIALFYNTCIISFLVLFGLRYLYYAISWSVKTIRQ